MIYLGTLGRMVGLKCPASQNVASEDRYTFETTLEGRRKALAKPVSRRSWSLQTSDATNPGDAAVITQFLQGAWGPGPFQFVPADAAHTNVMTPNGSFTIDEQPSAHVLRGGPVNLGAAGWAAQSLVSDDPITNFEMFGSLTYTPVLPGRVVTGSAWIAATPEATARVRLYWYDVNTVLLGGSLSREVSSSEGMVRVSVTGTPPPGAVSCRVVTLRAARMARPAITWTDTLQPWAAGEGCRQAVISPGSRDLQMAIPGMTYSNLSFTVTEVG